MFFRKKKIAGYKLVRFGLNQLTELEREVSDLIVRGWEPVGVLQQTITPEGRPLFIQQMCWYQNNT